MRLKKSEVSFLIDKYRKEGLQGKQIYNRLKQIYEFDGFIKFKKKYLK